MGLWDVSRASVLHKWHTPAACFCLSVADAASTGACITAATDLPPAVDGETATDGRIFAAGSEGGAIQVFDIRGRRQVAMLAQPGSTTSCDVNAVAWGGSGLLFAGSSRGVTSVFDLRHIRCVRDCCLLCCWPRTPTRYHITDCVAVVVALRGCGCAWLLLCVCVALWLWRLLRLGRWLYACGCAWLS